jgi:hypothetical protein
VGFLSPDIEHDVACIRSAFKPWFDLVEDFNQLAMRTLPAWMPSTRNVAELTGAMLCARAVTSLQGAILLAERGMLADARTLIRSMAETVITLSAVASDPEVCERLVDAHYRHNRMYHKALLDDPMVGSLLTPEQVVLIREAIAEWNQARPNAASMKRDPINVWDLAKLGGTVQIYNLVYRSSSGDAAHAMPAALNRHLRLRADGTATGLRFGPDVSDMTESLVLAVLAAAQLLEVAPRLFVREVVDEATMRQMALMEVCRREQARLLDRLKALGVDDALGESAAAGAS